MLSNKTIPTALEDRISPRETALLIIDMQNDFCSPGGITDRSSGDISRVQSIIPIISELLEAARNVGVLPIFIKNQSRPDGLTNAPSDLARRLMTYATESDLLATPEGSWGEQVVPALSPEPNDVIVPKLRPDAFEGTVLDIVLRSTGRKNLLITGTATHACVATTARRGLMMDYFVTVVQDGVAASDESVHLAALHVMRAFFGNNAVVNAKAVLRNWGSPT